MLAQASAGVPLLIGSCGTSGCDAAVDWTRDIAAEIAMEHGLKPRVALLRSEQPRARMKAFAEKGRVLPLPPVTDAAPQVFDGCDRIVALMGPEPYIAALEAGADIVLGGRTTDTAVIAAMPLMRGAGAGAAWHAGKTAECGGQCTIDPRSGGVIVRVGADGFEVEPLDSGNRCTPASVAAHMLYENSDPFTLIEPGGVLDVSSACYRAIDARRVQVTGSRFEQRAYTMKLEGAAGGFFQTLMVVGIRDRAVLADLDCFVAQMHSMLLCRVADTIGADAGAFDISLRPYGWNAVSGTAAEPGPPPREVGLMFVATAATHVLATRIAKTCNPIFFHMPLARGVELPSYAFPFSPAEIERGQVFEFKLNHVVRIDDPLELVRTDWVEMGALACA